MRDTEEDSQRLMGAAPEGPEGRCPVSDLARARAAKKHLLAQLSGRPGVNGVGIARRGSTYRLKVNVRDPQAAGELPAEVDGLEVTVAVVGTVQPHRAG
jgi:hypothetical protein